MKVEQNIARLKHLLTLYDMSAEELLPLISEGLAKPITKEQLLGESIELAHLKRIDKVFNKGLHYYLDPQLPEVSKEASIFFRKNKFGTELNMGAKKIVNQFEAFKISLSAISKLAELNLERSLPVYTIHDSPQAVAANVRKALYPAFDAQPKEFLRALLSTFAEQNILVFEFVETWNKRDKANIDGFFLNPNVIVLKRQQASFRREIFTLIHELGHYLLNEEEIEALDVSSLANYQLSAIERWCNDFAYYFLAGPHHQAFAQIERAEASNDYHFELIESISKQTHLSQIALFTKLLYQNKISQSNYNSVKANFEEQYRLRQEAEQAQRALDKLQGIQRGGATPKPMQSPLLISTIQAAFYEGVLSEYEVCKTLNIAPHQLESYLQ